MLKSLSNYLDCSDFSLNYCGKHIYINNFIDILILEPEKIVLSMITGKIIIRGNNILINKLLDKEILLSGDFKSIELGENNV